MPLYAFKDIETGEEWEELFSFSAKDEYLKTNPSVQQVLCTPAIISGIAGITHKNDSGFNDMLGRIAAANPHSPLAQVHGSKGIKESKTREAVNKARSRLPL